MESRSIVPLPGETWKAIPWTEGVYHVSDQGRVRRTEGWRANAYCHITRQQDVKGYGRVRLKFNGRQVERMVHRLVAEAFLGPCPANLVVNHKDLDKRNNTPANLEYLTSGENVLHAYMSYRYIDRERSASKFPGVRWIKREQCWRAVIGINGTRHYLGTFDNEHRAALAYLRARVERELTRRAG